MELGGGGGTGPTCPCCHGDMVAELEVGGGGGGIPIPEIYQEAAKFSTTQTDRYIKSTIKLHKKYDLPWYLVSYKRLKCS